MNPSAACVTDGKTKVVDRRSAYRAYSPPKGERIPRNRGYEVKRAEARYETVFS